MEFDGINLKGIMLCTRPTSDSALNLQKSYVWNCKKVIDPLGLGKVLKKDALSARYFRKLNVIEKHKKWLTVLENERAEAVAKREEEVKLKKEIRQKFDTMETENRRKAIANKYSAVPTPTPTTNILKSLTALDKIKRKNKNKKSRCRPAWSHAESSATLTNEEGINKSINNNETEICSDDISLGDEDLLEFAANLNFETDTQDIELRNLINILESRIGTLEKEVEKEKLISDRLPENRICNSMVSEQERELIVSNNSNDKKSQEDNEVEDEDKVLLRAARNLLTNRYFKFHQSSETGSRSGDENVDEDDEHALQFVHSQRSLVAVLKALKHSFQAESVEMRKT